MKNDLFTLEYGKESIDCTCECIIRLLRECTVREFIWEWFERYPKEWGYFSVHDQIGRFANLNARYKHTIILEDPIPDEVLNAKLLRVDGSESGWTRSDLVFHI